MQFFRCYVPFLIMLLLGAAAWRIEMLGRFLEYDEIWTLENFSGLDFAGIFRDLSTPNNHPLNSLLVKYLYAGNNWSIRLGSLCFSCGTVILGGLIARRIYSKTAAAYTFAALALLPPFVAAGCTARGYAGQLFFLMLFAYALLRCRKGDTGFTVLGAVSAVVAVVALPSSILYIVPLGIFFLITLLKKQRLCRGHIYIFGAAAVFAGGWYYLHWFDFLESGKFAIPVNNLAELGSWLKNVCHGNAVFIPLLLMALVIKRKRKISGILAILFFFPLVMAYFSGAAPARVYLPGAAAAVMLTAPVSVRFRKSWFIAALAVQFAVSYSMLPDMSLEETVRKCEKSVDIPVYLATDGYIVQFNYPQAIEGFYRKLNHYSRRKNCTLRLVSANGTISGLDKDGNNVSWQLPVAGETLKLHRISELASGQTAFLLLPPLPPAVMGGVLKSLSDVEMLKLNAWLSIQLTTPDGSARRYMLLAIRSRTPRSFPAALPVFGF